MINIHLPDQSIMELPENSTAYDAARKISRSLAKEVLAAIVNGKETDITTVLKDGDSLRLITFEDDEGKVVMRHSGSHLMAQAVKRLFPGTQLTIGPAIENGFYYDFDFEGSPLKTDYLEKIEKEMVQIVKEDLPLERLVIETDAPYLTPVPHRGKRNEPDFIPYIGEKMAEIRQIATEEVARITTENAIRLFRLNPQLLFA